MAVGRFVHCAKRPSRPTRQTSPATRFVLPSSRNLTCRLERGAKHPHNKQQNRLTPLLPLPSTSQSHSRRARAWDDDGAGAAALPPSSIDRGAPARHTTRDTHCHLHPAAQQPRKHKHSNMMRPGLGVMGGAMEDGCNRRTCTACRSAKVRIWVMCCVVLLVRWKERGARVCLCV